MEDSGGCSMGSPSMHFELGGEATNAATTAEKDEVEGGIAGLGGGREGCRTRSGASISLRRRGSVRTVERRRGFAKDEASEEEEDDDDDDDDDDDGDDERGRVDDGMGGGREGTGLE